MHRKCVKAWARGKGTTGGRRGKANALCALAVQCSVCWLPASSEAPRRAPHRNLLSDISEQSNSSLTPANPSRNPKGLKVKIRYKTVSLFKDESIFHTIHSMDDYLSTAVKCRTTVSCLPSLPRSLLVDVVNG